MVLCSLYYVSTPVPSAPAFTYRVSERGHVMYAGSTCVKWVAVGRGAFHWQWEDSLKNCSMFNYSYRFEMFPMGEYERIGERRWQRYSSLPGGRGRQRLFMVITSSLRDGWVMRCHLEILNEVEIPTASTSAPAGKTATRLPFLNEKILKQISLLPMAPWKPGT